MSDLQAVLSPDGRFFAYKDSPSSNLYLQNLALNQKCQVANESATCFAFNYDSHFLAFGDESGHVSIYNTQSNSVASRFEKLSSSGSKMVACLFHYDKKGNFLVSVDDESTIYVSNVDKEIARLHVYERHVFTDRFDGIGKIKDVLPCCSLGDGSASKNKDLVYVLFEHSFVLFNLSTGKFSKKQTPIPCVLDANHVAASSTPSEVLAKVDKNTVIKFTNKLKYSEALTNTFDLTFKKRFPNQVTSFKAILDSYSIVLENNGTLNILKTDKDLIRAKLTVLRANPTSSKKSRKSSTATFDQEKSQILHAELFQNTKLLIIFGENCLNFHHQVYDFDEFLALANSRRQILVRIDKDELENGKEINTVSSQVSATVKSDKNFDYDEVSGHKRKFTEMEDDDSTPKTIGETLEEKLKIAENENEDDNDTAKTKNKKNQNSAGDINANDRSVTVSQALQAENLNTIKEIILESSDNQEIVYHTVKNLPKTFIPNLIRVLSDFVRDNSSFDLSNNSLEWVKLLLKLHPNYILTNANRSHKSLLKIHQLADEKRQYSSLLGKLSGKISYFLSDPSDKSNSYRNSSIKFSSAQAMSRNLGGISTIQPQFIYEADNDSDEDGDDEDEDDDDDENDDEIEELGLGEYEDMEGSDIEGLEDEEADEDGLSDEMGDSDEELNNNKLSDRKLLSVKGGRFGGMESPESSENEALEPVKV